MKRYSEKMWCVKNQGGWCIIADGKPFPESQDCVETVCGMVIILPWGCEKREPTCDDCKKMRKEGGKKNEPF